MYELLTRHAVQVLLGAGHSQEDVASRCNVSVRTVRRIAEEEVVTDVDDAAERRRRRVGRPSKTEPYRPVIVEILAADPGLMSLEVLRRCREKGYTGRKSALYELVSQLRPSGSDFVMRFEGVPGEFSQHDFGQVVVRFTNGATQRIHFFASRLKWSRTVAVSLVPDERAETLVRTALEHFIAFGGVPLCAVFDRPKTVALKWRKDGTITEWNPVFADAALAIGFTAEVCWPHAPQQKGAVENLVGWVKGSFFKQRRFVDLDDLQSQLAAWHTEVNEQRECRATGVIPAARLAEERVRLRPPRVTPDELALRVSTSVSPTARVTFEGTPYSMPPKAAGLPATLYVHRDRIRIVAGPHEAIHDRTPGAQEPRTLPEHRQEQVDAVHGTRGKRFLKREHLAELGEGARAFLTELVHRRPTAWHEDVTELHDLLQRHGAEPLQRALRAALDVGRFDVGYVRAALGCPTDVSTEVAG